MDQQQRKFVRLRNLAFRFPKWVIAGGILVFGCGVFVCWWRFRQPAGTPAVRSSAHPPRKIASFSPDQVILCGNTLVHLQTGEILAQEWLEGFGSRVPNIVKVLPDERLVLVTGNDGMLIPFDFDGNAKPALAADGKLMGAAAFAEGGREAVFVRDGNLWCGRVDWKNSNVETPHPVTDTGYFRGDVFRSAWLWQGDSLWLVNLGRLMRVNLTDGSVTPDKANIADVLKGISPDRSAVLMPVGLREMGVVDLISGETSVVATGQHVNRVLWLTKSTAVVLVGQNQLGLYDHTTKRLTGIFKSPEPIRNIVAPSPDGKRFLLSMAKSAGFYDLNKGNFTAFSIPINQVDWVSTDALLISSTAANSDQRGVWLMVTGQALQRLTNVPADAMMTPMLSKGYFVCGGDLWFYDQDSGRLQKLTQSKNLPSCIISLNKSA